MPAGEAIARFWALPSEAQGGWRPPLLGWMADGWVTASVLTESCDMELPGEEEKQRREGSF